MYGCSTEKPFAVINLGFILEKGYSKAFWVSRWQLLGLCDWESHNVRACCVENTELEAKTENYSGRVSGKRDR